MSTFLVAWSLPREHTLLRALWALFAFAGMMRVTDLAVTVRQRWPAWRRMVHVLSVFDTRRMTNVPPAFDAKGWGVSLGWLLLAWGMYLALGAVPRPSSVHDVSLWGERWLLALVLVYALSAGAYDLAQATFLSLGWRTVPLHIAPALARSVQEFWGERWNRTVSTWLGEVCFRPLARRRMPWVGAWLAFFLSALLHAYLTWVSVGWALALVMLSYFLLQALLIVVEQRLGVRRWSRAMGHVWTVSWMVLLSPMFTEPLAQALGV
jgi:hypothetical protein